MSRPILLNSAMGIFVRIRGWRVIGDGLAVLAGIWRAWDWAVEGEAATMLRPLGLFGSTSLDVLRSVIGRGDR